MQLKKTTLSRLLSSLLFPCQKCGVSGIHSCIGSEIPKISEEELRKLEVLMKEIFGEKYGT